MGGPAAHDQVVPKTTKNLRQDWPWLDVESQGRIVGGLIAMSKPGATTTRVLPDGRTITTKVKRRHALRAIELASQLGSLGLEQQKDDHQAKLHNNDNNLTFNDITAEAGPVLDIAGPRLNEEVKRQGVSCVAELPQATVEAICAQAEKEYEAQHGPKPQRGPKPIKQTPPEQRQDWGIPLEDQRMIMARLQDMTDPIGQEYQVMRDRERLRAVRVLIRFGRLVLAQARWDRLVETGEQPFDWDAFFDEADKKSADRIAERKRESEEFWRKKREREARAAERRVLASNPASVTRRTWRSE